MTYGEEPVFLGKHNVDCPEMMFYQDMPIKLKNSFNLSLEQRLEFVLPLVEVVTRDFVDNFGLAELGKHYMYISVKKLFQAAGSTFNRQGYHTDGFLTDDITYIWSDENPTIFNVGEFNLTLDDSVSIQEMEEQAKPENEVVYMENSLIRINQFNVHKVAVPEVTTLRTFIKISFSKDKYNLKGNSHNYNLKYDWDMRERGLVRNTPQKLEE